MSPPSLLLSLSLLCVTAVQSACIGAACYSGKGGPIGGGSGYPNIVRKSSAKYVVDTLAELQRALAAATKGDVVYVSDDAQINTGSTDRMVIKAGVTLASGRGNGGSKGGLIYTNANPHILLLISGADVRITGLRIRGADGNAGASIDTYGISNNGFPRTIIDNAEIYQWGAAGIAFNAGATGCIVKNCAIHHNRASGMGYGVNMGRDTTASRRIDVTIEANLFWAHRHAISAAGDHYGSYVAQFNVVLGPMSSRAFDRHGTEDEGTWQKGDGGDYTIIRYNSFGNLNGQKAVTVRGLPRFAKGVQVKGNQFNCGSQANCILLWYPKEKSTYEITGNKWDGPANPDTNINPDPDPQPSPEPKPDPDPEPSPKATAKFRQDLCIFEGDPMENYDGNTFLGVGWVEEGQEARSLAQWTITAAPRTKLSSATLSLFWYDTTSSSRRDTVIEVYRVASPWDEGTATWYDKSDQDSWNEEGGDWYDSKGVAHGSSPFAKLVVSGDRDITNSYLNIDVTKLVQGWIDGTWKNNGLLLRAKSVSSGGSNYLGFHSAKIKVSKKVPKLTLKVSS